MERGKGRNRVGIPEKRLGGTELELAKVIGLVRAGIDKTLGKDAIKEAPSFGDVVNRTGIKPDGNPITKKLPEEKTREQPEVNQETAPAEQPKRKAAVSSTMGLNKKKTGMQL